MQTAVASEIHLAYGKPKAEETDFLFSRFACSKNVSVLVFSSTTFDIKNAKLRKQESKEATRTHTYGESTANQAHLPSWWTMKNNNLDMDLLPQHLILSIHFRQFQDILQAFSRKWVSHLLGTTMMCTPLWR